MSAIVVEEALTEIFRLIPERSFLKDGREYPVNKPKYHFGDEQEFNAFIKESKNDVYPLIYQTSDTEEQNDNERTVTTEIVLVLAKNNKRTELLNTVRWATSYRNILIPLVNNIVQAFNESGWITWDGNYSLKKRPNYSQTDAKDSNAVIDIIDAVIFTATIKIDNENVCINKNINFNN